MAKYIISHRRKGQTLSLGFVSVGAITQTRAIAKATALWIEGWNLAFPHNPNGESEVANMEFICEAY